MGENKKKSCKLANLKIQKAKQKKKSIEASNLPRCLQKRKKLGRYGKGKSVSANIPELHMDIDQEAIGIQFEEEMILEILSRLPVQSLLRFKCISKFWKALISDSYFKMKHLNHAKNDQDSQNILVGRCCADEDEWYNFYSSSLSSVLLIEDEQKLDCPSTCKRVRSIICSCDGLVLLSVTGRLGKQLLLWNPSTRESVVLPHPDYAPRYLVWGLGYDATNDEYKILAINLGPGDSHEIFGQILALKSGIWRKTCEYPSGVRHVHGICSMGSLAFVHGAFHWLCFSQWYTVVSFNISNEQYGEITLVKRIFNTPLYFRGYPFNDIGISVLGGMLCFYSTYCSWPRITFKLFVMKDYGDAGSWHQLLTLSDVDLFHFARPKYMFAGGEILLYCISLTCSSVYRKTRGRSGLWPQCVTHKEGIVYTKSLISPKLLI